MSGAADASGTLGGKLTSPEGLERRAPKSIGRHARTTVITDRGRTFAMNTLDALDAELLRSDIPSFRPGDTLKVHVKVIEGNRSRVQVFQAS